MEVWQSTGDSTSTAQQERRGVEYLRSLGQLTAALTQAQSTAVLGRPIDAASLTGAIAGVAEVDARLGDALRTHDRWTGLRGKIETLSTAQPATGQPAYDAYGEVTGLLLALYGVVQENSDLVREPQADAYYLQDGVAKQLPEFLVTTGRFSDRALIVSRTLAQLSPNDRASQVGQLFAAQDAVSSPAQDLNDDLQAAVSVSESPTLGSHLFNLLDRLRITMDAVDSSTFLADGEITQIEIVALAALRASAVETVNPLYASVLDELDKLIVTRLDKISSDRRIAIVALSLAVVLAITPILMLTVARLRTRRRPGPPGRHGRPEPEDSEAQAQSPPPNPGWSAGLALPAGPRERERSGAAR